MSEPAQRAIEPIAAPEAEARALFDRANACQQLLVSLAGLFLHVVCKSVEIR